MAITTTITVDGKEVTLRASAAVPRLYRIKFRRDIVIDMKRITEDMEKKKKKKNGFDLPMETITIFENVAYIMAKHGDKDHVPDSPDAWLDTLNTFSIYKVFPVIEALWAENLEALDIAKKNLAP